MVALLCTVALPACPKEQQPPPPDAPPEVQCWSGGGTATPGASVALGTGQTAFVPIEAEQELPLYQGPQGGAHFFLHARIDGLSPGDISGRTAPPTYTRFSIHGEDGTDMSLQPCDYPYRYIDNGDGSFQVEYARLVRLGTPYLTSVYGQRVRLQVEVLDGQDRYATDERWVVVVDPLLADAGVPDADPADAGALDAAASR